jgi:hypothetical protein
MPCHSSKTKQKKQEHQSSSVFFFGETFIPVHQRLRIPRYNHILKLSNQPPPPSETLAAPRLTKALLCTSTYATNTETIKQDPIPTTDIPVLNKASMKYVV